ncbi:hypothetical protein ANO11243_009670 [Dothideomycetidae sp. 11243]|nr:hypothetical protein ANO11243_009670 [fungal sp. No.11243]
MSVFYLQRFLSWLSFAIASEAALTYLADIADGSDLLSFVSRPDIRAPAWKVTKHKPESISPGYWFVAPYTKWPSKPFLIEYMPYQVGPHIYDGNGDLIWSGAGLDRNRNVQDFRPYTIDNQTYLSYILAPLYEQSLNDSNGVYVTMGSDYRRKTSIIPEEALNGHEFRVLDKGSKALVITTRTKSQDTRGQPKSAISFGRYLNDCVGEMDMKTGNKTFEWCAMDHGVSGADTFEKLPDNDEPWDFMHINSVERFGNGDLLLSARYTNTLYRVSRADKSILWELGGKHSDFQMSFNFSAQHYARIVSENSTTTVVLMLDNASVEVGRDRDSANMSSAKMMALHTAEQPMRAEWDRPDGNKTRKRGNVDILAGGNIWVGWSERSYVSEHTYDGELLLEAQFTSNRFGTYRAYKSPFIGNPTEPPAIKAFQYASLDGANVMTTAYVSWNGATEVRSWKFLGFSSGCDETSEIAMVDRTGFETSITVSGSWSNITAMALDAGGREIGRSAASGLVSDARRVWAAIPTRLQVFLLATMSISAFMMQCLIVCAFIWVRKQTRRSKESKWEASRGVYTKIETGSIDSDHEQH